MVRISLQRVVLFIGFVVLAAMFFLVLTLSALSVPTTISSPLPEGPYLVKDIMPDEADSFPAPIIPARDMVYFFAYDAQGRNLWVSDGTENGTQQVKDLNEFTGAVANPQKPTPYPTPQNGYDYPEAVNNQLFFANNDGINGTELWISDGSNMNTFMVKDIYTGTFNSGPFLLTNVTDQLFFTANDGIHGRDLWVSDGTVTNTNMVKDITGIDYLDLANMNGKAYFAGSDGIHGYELWTSDGTEGGTHMVKDIRPDSASSNPNLFYATDTHVFFFAHSPGYGYLWQSDGSMTGTIPVQDTISGATFSVDSPGFRATADENFFFTAYNNVNQQLWVSDGTITGTHFVKEIRPSYYYGHSIGNHLFFFASDGEHGTELWVSDGTDGGTYLIKDINPGASSSRCSISTFESITDLNGSLFFTANDGNHGCELWMSDGSEDGTFMVQDLKSGSSSSNPENLAAANNTLFFTIKDEEYGAELWSLGNMAPVAKDDTAVSSMNHPVTIPVVENDFDVNLDAFTIAAVTQPSSGVVTIQGEAVIYTPDDAFIGSDTFTYTVQESGGGLTAVAQVNVTVTGNRVYLPVIMHLLEN